LDRKRFFENTGKTFLFAIVASIIPVKLFTSRRKKNIKVEIHPSAVKREN